MSTQFRLLGVLGVGVAVTACNTEELTPAGANVATSNTAPVDQGYNPKDCRSLGYIVGRGGGSFGGGWISNDSLVEYAMNDLRNKAAALGANFIQHDTPQMGMSGDKNGVTTSTATVSGTAYYCSRGSGAAKDKATAADAPSKKSLEPPTGAAGFVLGSSVEEAEAACKEKFEWASTSEDNYGCSGTPRSIGKPATTLLRFCGRALCRIELVVRPESEDSKEWLSAFVAIDKSLEKKYGAGEEKKKFPQECNPDILPCVKKGGAWLKYEWTFGKGTKILLRLTNKPGPDPMIRLVYEGAEASGEPAL